MHLLFVKRSFSETEIMRGALLWIVPILHDPKYLIPWDLPKSNGQQHGNKMETGMNHGVTGIIPQDYAYHSDVEVSYTKIMHGMYSHEISNY